MTRISREDMPITHCCSRPRRCCWRSTTAAAAQDYPTKPVRLIVPFPPGGINDIVGRMIATQLSDAARQADHRRQPRRRRRRDRHRARGQCAEGRLHAAGRLARERGQSLALQAALRSDQERSRRSRIVATAPNVLVGQSGAAGRSRSKELIALAKEKPGELQYASGRRRQLPASRRRAVQARRPASTCCTCRSRAAGRP